MRKTTALTVVLGLVGTVLIGGAVLANTNGTGMALCATAGGNVVLPQDDGLCKKNQTTIELATEEDLAGLATQVTDLEARVAALEALLEGVERNGSELDFGSIDAKFGSLEAYFLDVGINATIGNRLIALGGLQVDGYAELLGPEVRVKGDLVLKQSDDAFGVTLRENPPTALNVLGPMQIEDRIFVRGDVGLHGDVWATGSVWADIDGSGDVFLYGEDPGVPLNLP